MGAHLIVCPRYSFSAAFLKVAENKAKTTYSKQIRYNSCSILLTKNFNSKPGHTFENNNANSKTSTIQKI